MLCDNLAMRDMIAQISWKVYFPGNMGMPISIAHEIARSIQFSLLSPGGLIPGSLE
jgi:hypothetical protein